MADFNDIHSLLSQKKKKKKKQQQQQQKMHSLMKIQMQTQKI